MTASSGRSIFNQMQASAPQILLWQRLVLNALRRAILMPECTAHNLDTTLRSCKVGLMKSRYSGLVFVVVEA